MITRTLTVVAAVVLADLACLQPLQARAVGCRTLVLAASLAARASVTVSTSRLMFEVTPEGQATETTIAYRAAARTRKNGAVLLAVTQDGPVESRDGARVPGLGVTCAGDAVQVPLAAGSRQIVGRWQNSGVKNGTVVCRLDGTVAPGSYSAAVRFDVILD